jgi:uncharacterized membrane protein SpoIIM required for sporulation
MKQDVFQARHAAEWDTFERWLAAREAPRRKDRAAADTIMKAGDFPLALRRLCQQLALAERRDYSAQLVRRLRDLAQRGHQVLYKPGAPRLRRVVDFFAATFPRLVREQWRAMAASAALFFLPLTGVIVLLHFRPELIHSLFGPEQLAQFENMYDPSKTAERLGRTDGTDLQMFGYYIFNNVGIGFRTFASGLIAGIGAVFVLVMNGVIIGGVAGHLTEIGYGEPFWHFVAGHSAPELLAIVISGGAGLQIGMALIAPDDARAAARSSNPASSAPSSCSACSPYSCSPRSSKRTGRRSRGCRVGSKSRSAFRCGSRSRSGSGAAAAAVRTRSPDACAWTISASCCARARRGKRPTSASRSCARTRGASGARG